MPSYNTHAPGSKTPMHLRDKRKRTGGREQMTVGQAVHSIWGWTDEEARQFADLAVNAGYLKMSTIDRTALSPLWTRLVEAAAGTFGNGGTSTPWELLSRYAKGGTAAESLAKTRTSRSYSVVSALTAEELAHAALSERLGRDATDTELAEFKAELIEAEKKNPTITTTTTDAEGVVTSSKTQEGLNYQKFAGDYALEHNKDEANAYQGAGQIMPWFWEAIGPVA